MSQGNKHKLIKKIKQYFNTELIDYQMHLSMDVINKGLIFRDGFFSCIECVKTEPINTKELQDLLFKETVRYIVRLIENGKEK